MLNNTRFAKPFLAQLRPILFAALAVATPVAADESVSVTAMAGKGANVVVALAGERPAQRLHWYCWLSGRTTMSCLLESAPSELATDGVDFRSLARLPEIVTDMHTSPERLRGEKIDIPLFDQPRDMSFAELLAQSVMCGSQQKRSVSFSEHPDIARITALLQAEQ